MNKDTKSKTAKTKDRASEVTSEQPKAVAETPALETPATTSEQPVKDWHQKPKHRKPHIGITIAITASVFAACALSFIGGVLVGQGHSKSNSMTQDRQQMMPPSGEIPQRRQLQNSNSSNTNNTSSTTNSTNSTTTN